MKTKFLTIVMLLLTSVLTSQEIKRIEGKWQIDKAVINNESKSKSSFNCEAFIEFKSDYTFTADFCAFQSEDIRFILINENGVKESDYNFGIEIKILKKSKNKLTIEIDNDNEVYYLSKEKQKVSTYNDFLYVFGSTNFEGSIKYATDDFESQGFFDGGFNVGVMYSHSLKDSKNNKLGYGLSIIPQYNNFKTEYLGDEFQINKITVPLGVNVNMMNNNYAANWSLFAGGYYGQVITGKFNDEDILKHLKKDDYGLHFMLTAAWTMFTFNLSYQHSLSDLNNLDTPYKLEHSMLSLGVGFPIIFN